MVHGQRENNNSAIKSYLQDLQIAPKMTPNSSFVALQPRRSLKEGNAHLARFYSSVSSQLEILLLPRSITVAGMILFRLLVV